MNNARSFTVSLLLFIASASLYVVPRAQPPAPQGPHLNASYIDADTGHRVVRLTDEAGGSTLYFHDNAFSPEGDTADVQHAQRDCDRRGRENRHRRRSRSRSWPRVPEADILPGGRGRSTTPEAAAGP